jgi:hypothetical protein
MKRSSQRSRIVSVPSDYRIVRRIFKSQPHGNQHLSKEISSPMRYTLLKAQSKLAQLAIVVLCGSSKFTAVRPIFERASCFPHSMVPGNAPLVVFFLSESSLVSPGTPSRDQYQVQRLPISTSSKTRFPKAKAGSVLCASLIMLGR